METENESRERKQTKITDEGNTKWQEDRSPVRGSFLRSAPRQETIDLPHWSTEISIRLSLSRVISSSNQTDSIGLLSVEIMLTSDTTIHWRESKHTKIRLPMALSTPHQSPIRGHEAGWNYGKMQVWSWWRLALSRCGALRPIWTCIGST